MPLPSESNPYLCLLGYHLVFAPWAKDRGLREWNRCEERPSFDAISRCRLIDQQVY